MATGTQGEWKPDDSDQTKPCYTATSTFPLQMQSGHKRTLFPFFLRTTSQTCLRMTSRPSRPVSKERYRERGSESVESLRSFALFPCKDSRKVSTPFSKQSVKVCALYWGKRCWGESFSAFPNATALPRAITAFNFFAHPSYIPCRHLLQSATLAQSARWSTWH